MEELRTLAPLNVRLKLRQVMFIAPLAFKGRAISAPHLVSKLMPLSLCLDML